MDIGMDTKLFRYLFIFRERKMPAINMIPCRPLLVWEKVRKIKF